MAGSILQHYLHQLTDLSIRNKSLYLPKTEGNGVIDLQELDFLNGESAFEVLRKSIAGKKKIELIPVVDPRLPEVNLNSKLLAKIAFRDQLTQEETGDQSLFLAWPFVEGKLLNGQLLRAPLILLPCILHKEGENWTLLPNGFWQWNTAFLLAYSHGNGAKLDLELLDESLEALPTDPLEFRTALAKLLETHFALQLSSKLFEDRITTFPISQTSIDKASFQDGKLALKTYALLGQFAQKGNFLFNDYEALIRDYSSDSLEGLFENQFQTQEISSMPREDQLFPVFGLDAAQENVLMKVRQGKSLVVEGPPGTGKSQLIANLVSDYIARGKKVLVVSQKRAALDVVFERMAKAGFGAFLGLVHDFKGDQKTLFKKLRDQIEAIEKYQEENRGLDSMQLEREISTLSMTIMRLSEKFENFREALFDASLAGLPIKAMYLNSGGLKRLELESKSSFLALKFEQAGQFEKELMQYKGYQELFRNTFWEERNSFAQLEPAHFLKIQEMLKAIENYRPQVIGVGISEQGLQEFERQILGGKISSRTISSLKSTLENSSNPALACRLALFSEDLKPVTVIQDWIQTALPKLQNLELAIPDRLLLLADEFHRLAKVQESWLGKQLVRFKKGQFPLIDAWLREHRLGFTAGSISVAKSAFLQIQQLENELNQLPRVPCFAMSLSALLSSQKELAEAQLWAQQWAALPILDAIADRDADGDSQAKMRASLGYLQKHGSDFEQNLAGWRIFLSSAQLSKLLFEKVKIEQANLLQTFSELVAFDRFLEHWGLDKLSFANQILEFSNGADSANPSSIFWNGWYQTWIGELERRNPVLAEAGSLKMRQEMAELKDAILEKRKISRFMSLLRLRERLTDSLEFNRLGNRLTYRELLHQVSKKRQKWPIRKLMEEFSQEIFRLIPCWLASPETVSALFPMSQSVDLVIFDEASQCLVERGLPAMLRGRQVVVAGDSQQLKPSDFYQVRWESDEEGLEYEAESLLELAGNFFEKVMLTGHYRSADPGLIDFSNRKFYEGKLAVLPDLNTAIAGKSPFTWEKMEGIWENQVNKSEADAVVERVRQLLTTFPGDSIGIVTGNYFQMELIREKLWDNGIQGEQIKVRNIENVQGDEFDQVILSLGYAPNREGKLVTNFGLLGKAGAENRLNVAITRSRKAMHVISSIEPEDFRPGQLQNPGLVLLREFLGFVRKQAKHPHFEVIETDSEGYEIDWSLKSHLINSDLGYSKQVPSVVMDLLKMGPEFPSAVLTDDQRFFDAPSAKAAMAFHPILLEGKGWSWEWRWSREEFFRGE